MPEPGAASRARRQRARLLTLLADWHAGAGLCDGDDPRRDAWLELERITTEDALRLPPGEPRVIAGLAERFFAAPDADLLLELAAVLEGRAQRFEALDAADAARANEDDDDALVFEPARTVALVPPVFAAN